MSLFASKQGRARPLGLIYVFSPGSVRHEAASSPSWADLRTLVSWIPKLGSDGLSDALGELNNRYVLVESGSVVRNGVDIALMWHSTAP